MAVAVLEERDLEALVERVLRRVLGEQRPASPAPATPASDLTTEQVAAELGLAEKTIRKYARIGRLKGSRRGGEWRFPRSSLDLYRATKQDLAARIVASLDRE